MVLSAHYVLLDYDKHHYPKPPSQRKATRYKNGTVNYRGTDPSVLGLFSATTSLLQRNGSEADVKQPTNCLI